jgi:FKBP-type peptidyl-prolyl cis-trans isomerase
LKIQHSALLLLAGLLAACDAGPPTLTTDGQKASYAIGLDIGRTLLPAKDSINMDAFRAGVQDILDGKEPALAEDSLNAALQRFAEVIRTSMMSEEQKGAIAKNESEGKLYMEENGKRQGVVTTPGGVQIETIQPGTGAKVAISDEVTIKYKGTLVDGTMFDTSEGQPGDAVTFGVMGVIPGFTDALQQMSVGGKYKIVIPGSLAYGPQGSPPTIGPNQTLLFDVEVVSAKPATGAPAGAVPPAGTVPPPQN